jgi:protein-tyrosine sulfotransferase
MKIPLKRLLPDKVKSPLKRLRERMTDRILLSDRPWIRRSKWPVRDASKEGPCIPFFIIATPRSGTTLLRAILAQHPTIFIPPENGNIGAMIRTFGSYRGYPWNSIVDAVFEVFRQGYGFRHWKIDLAEVKRTAEALPIEERTLAMLIHLLYYTYGAIHSPGKTRWGDKTVPGSIKHVEKVDLVFPEARYIHIVRDGRDCLASCMKSGFFGRDYIRGAYVWKNNIRRCQLFGKRLKRQNRFFELRYEDLVSTPAQVVSAVCSFLALEATEAMLHYRGTVDHMPDILSAPYHRNVLRPIFRDSIGKWEQQLPQSTLHAVMKIIGPELAIWGYK